MRRSPVIALIALGFATSSPAQEPTQRELLDAVEKQLKATVATAGPSIACVVVSRSDRYPKAVGAVNPPGKLGGFDVKEFLKDDASREKVQLARSLDLSDPKAIPDHGYAGGVVIDAAGLVLTPYHAIDGATRVYVFLAGGIGSYADIHAADARSDLAVLKLIAPPEKLTAIKFADVRTAARRGRPATVFPGKLVVLMANSYSSTFGVDRASAAFGSLTNVRVKMPAPPKESQPTRHSEYGTFLEYDVKMNSGVTGGILLNLDGEMIGMTNAAAVAWGNEVGPGYAVPADEFFRKVIEPLRRGEEVEYGFLGVTHLIDQRKLAVVPITNGPADLAGIGPGDEIVSIEGTPVGSFNDLLLHVGSALAGSKVKIIVGRLGREREVEVALSKYKNAQPYIASVRPEPIYGLRVDYSSIITQQRNPNDPQDVRAVPPGVSVRDVVAESAAAKQFKTLGDDPKRWLVTKVNGTPIADPAAFYKAAKGQEKVKLSLRDPADPSAREKEVTLP